jgi:membrane fusion protein (multidrug efflux system)
LTERSATLRATAINPNDRALAESRINQAQQRIGTLDAQLSYATIRAPITGLVTNQYQFQGEYAAAGAKLVDIADTSEVIVKLCSPTKSHRNSKPEMRRRLFLRRARRTDARASHARQPRERSTNRTSEVWVRLGNEAGRLKTGGAAQVRIASQEHRNAVVVPTAAITLEASNGKGTVIVVDAQNVAHETKVTTGLRAGDRIEIVSGLSGNETIVIEGNFALPDGTKVEPQDAKEAGANDESNKGSESDKGTAGKSSAADEKPGAGVPESKQ